MEHGSERKAHQQREHREERRALDGHAEQHEAHRPAGLARGGDADHHEHDDQVLDDEDADGKPAVQTSISRRSERSLTTMIVLENASPIPT